MYTLFEFQKLVEVGRCSHVFFSKCSDLEVIENFKVLKFEFRSYGINSESFFSFFYVNGHMLVYIYFFYTVVGEIQIESFAHSKIV